MNFKGTMAFLATHKKALFVGATIVLVIYLLSSGGSHKKIKEEAAKGSGTITTEDRLKADVEALRKKIEKLESEKGQPAKKEEAGKEKKPETVTGKEQEKPESLKELEKILKPHQKPAVSPFASPGGAAPFPTEAAPVPLKKPEVPRLLKIDVSEAPPTEKKQERPTRESRAGADLFLPVGSFASFTLTSEAFAPETGQQMPVSGVIDKAFVGPNRSAVPLRGCYFLGKAQGNTGEKIADIKVVKMSCVWPNGQSFEADIAGYVTDVNGDFGMKGTVERHYGTYFSTVGISSFIEGIATGMARAQESTTLGTSPYGVQSATNIVGNAAEYGALKGAADFATASKKFFDKQAENLVPTVIVPAGRKGYVYITSGVTITGGMNALAGSNSYYDSYNLSRSK